VLSLVIVSTALLWFCALTCLTVLSGLLVTRVPPTPSFPAGHTAAALALHGAAALLIVRRARRRPPWLLLLVPAAIGVARLYRGLHHPSDAVAGALLGAMCVAAAQLEAARVGGLPPARTDPGT
jgi:membrane-associated phospholipid phosphatase